MGAVVLVLVAGCRRWRSEEALGGSTSTGEWLVRLLPSTVFLPYDPLFASTRLTSTDNQHSLLTEGDGTMRCR